MTGIIIPDDRTIKQQPRGYCLNPACRENSLADRFEFDVDDDRFACPKCGADGLPMAGLLVLTHFLIQDKRGPLIGSGNIRYRVACDSNRAYLATASNKEAASGEISSVNCRGCLEAVEREKINSQQGRACFATAGN